MEDAMIINKASFERGFGHGSMYKTHVYSLDEEEKMNMTDGIRPELVFSNIKSIKKDDYNIDESDNENDDDEDNAINTLTNSNYNKNDERLNSRFEKFHDHLDFDG